LLVLLLFLCFLLL